MRNAIATFILIFFTLAAFSQDEYIPAFYINEAGVKTDCLIQELGWKNTPQNFRYKLDKNGSSKKMELKDIATFGIKGGRKFVKYTVDVDQSYNDEFQDKINTAYGIDLRELSMDSLPDWKSETLLLETVVEGNVHLLSYQSGTRNRFFIKKKNEEPHQLVYKKYKVKADNSNLRYITTGRIFKADTIQENNRYKLQLVETANCHNASAAVFNSLVYEYNDIKKIVIDHNKCVNPNDLKVFSLPSIQNGAIRLHAFGRASSNSFNMNSSVIDVSFDAHYAFSGGLEIEYLPAYRNKKWIPFAQVVYNKYGGVSSKAVRNQGSPAILDEVYTIDVTALEIPIGIRHNIFLNDKNVLFLNAAFNILINIGDKNASRAEDLEYLLIHEKPNFIYGLGFKSNRFRIGLNYQFRRFIKQISWFSRYKQISLDAGWQIF